jgi:hypothetical protein
MAAMVINGGCQWLISNGQKARESRISQWRNERKKVMASVSVANDYHLIIWASMAINAAKWPSCNGVI